MQHPGTPEGGLPAAVSVPAAGSADFRARLQSEIKNLDPGYFALVMATGIVSVAVSAEGASRLSAILLGLAIVCYLVLVVAWFLWTVSTQSIAVAVTTLPPSSARALAPVAVGCWAVGVVLYLLTAALVLSGLLQFPVEPIRLSPAYWVFMGATAISVLAGARILGLPASPLVAAVHPVVAGLSVILWAFGTWLIPLLVGLGAWPHLVRRVPLRYEPPLWSMVFPLGMYCVASRALGLALNVSWLVAIGRDGTWTAFAVWALVFLAMLASLAGPPRSA